MTIQSEGLCNRDGLGGREQGHPSCEVDQDHQHKLGSEVAKSCEPQTRMFSPTPLAYPSPERSQNHIAIRYSTVPNTNFKTKETNIETSCGNPSFQRDKPTQNHDVLIKNTWARGINGTSCLSSSSTSRSRVLNDFLPVILFVMRSDTILLISRIMTLCPIANGQN